MKKIFNDKTGEQIPCRYSISTRWASGNIYNNHSLYRGEDCMKTFCFSGKEHAANLTNFEKKKMLH